MFKYHVVKNLQIDEELDYAKNDTRQIVLSQSEPSKNWRLQIPQAFRGIPRRKNYSVTEFRMLSAEKAAESVKSILASFLSSLYGLVALSTCFS